MKRSIVFFALSFMLFISVVALAAFLPETAPDTQIVNIGSDLVRDQATNSAGNWLANYWEYIALAASEIFAFLPTKYNGLAHALLTIGQALFGKKKENQLFNP